MQDTDGILRLKWLGKKDMGGFAAIWSLSGGLITSELKNSRAVAINDFGFVAVSQESDLPSPDVLWNIDTNEFEFQQKLIDKKDIGKKCIKSFSPGYLQFRFPLVHNGYAKEWSRMPGSFVVDINEQEDMLLIDSNNNLLPDLFFTKSGRTSVVRFQSDLYVNKKRLGTGLPIVNARLNDNDEIVAIVNVNGKQAIGSWGKEEGSTVSGCLQDNPHFKGYTHFAIAGFNDNGQILLRADVGVMDQIEYTPVKPRMFLILPKKK